MSSVSARLYHFLVDFSLIKYKFKRMNFDVTNLKLDFLAINPFTFFLNGFPAHTIHFHVNAIQFPDYANEFSTNVNHFPTYKIGYHVTEI